MLRRGSPYESANDVFRFFFAYNIIFNVHIENIYICERKKYLIFVGILKLCKEVVYFLLEFGLFFLNSVNMKLKQKFNNI